MASVKSFYDRLSHTEGNDGAAEANLLGTQAFADMMGDAQPELDFEFDATSEESAQRLEHAIEAEKPLMNQVKETVNERIGELRNERDMSREEEQDERRKIITAALEQAAIERENSGKPILVPVRVLAERIEKKLFGLGALEDFLERDNLSEIMINGTRSFWIEERGELKEIDPHPYPTLAETMTLIDRLATLGGVPAPDSDNPLLDAKFMYRNKRDEQILLRLNVASNLVTADQVPAITIRKPVRTPFFTIEPWIEQDSLTLEAANFLRACVRHRANMLLVGATGSGKTSLLRALMAEIPVDERTVITEDTHEIELEQSNVDYLLTKKGTMRAGIEMGRVSLSMLIANAMRMRPDRLIVGECRHYSEVGALVEAMNSGHDGSVTTTHASSAQDGLERLLTLAAKDPDNKAALRHVAKQIATSLDVVVFISVFPERRPDGSLMRMRRVAEIGLIDGMTEEGGEIRWFVDYPFRRESRGSPLKASPGALPARFINKMESFGLTEAQMRRLIDPRGVIAHGIDAMTDPSLRAL